MKKLSMLSFFLMLTATLLLSACGDDHDHDHPPGQSGSGHTAHDHEGPNGGHLFELGSVGHVEFVHDTTAGTVTMHITGPDLKTPITPDQPPQLKISTDDGPLVLTLKGDSIADSSRFSVSNSALKTGELNGRLSLKIEGSVFNPDLEEMHDD